MVCGLKKGISYQAKDSVCMNSKGREVKKMINFRYSEINTSSKILSLYL